MINVKRVERQKPQKTSGRIIYVKRGTCSMETPNGRFCDKRAEWMINDVPMCTTHCKPHVWTLVLAENGIVVPKHPSKWQVWFDKHKKRQ